MRIEKIAASETERSFFEPHRRTFMKTLSALLPAMLQKLYYPVLIALKIFRGPAGDRK